MATWYNFPETLPPDNTLIYFRPQYFYGPPILGRAHYSTTRFTEEAHGIIYPLYMVYKWRLA